MPRGMCLALLVFVRAINLQTCVHYLLGNMVLP